MGRLIIGINIDKKKNLIHLTVVETGKKNLKMISILKGVIIVHKDMRRLGKIIKKNIIIIKVVQDMIQDIMNGQSKKLLKVIIHNKLINQGSLNKRMIQTIGEINIQNKIIMLTLLICGQMV